MRVVVIGGGAAGMIAAITAAKQNHTVTLLEKNNALGNKIKITGKGRCNLTFEGDRDNFKRNVVQNNKFLYSAFSQFSNEDVVAYFNSLGVATKVERGGRIFPVSDDANEIVLALQQALKKHGVNILYRSVVKQIAVREQKVEAVVLENGTRIPCDACILATGGNSYTTTGSTGDGYQIAKALGHHVVPIRPGLVPLRSQDHVCTALQGLSLRNISFKIKEKQGTVIYEDFGEMLFSHFGLTGPVVLSSSSKLNRVEDVDNKIKQKEIIASIDLKPALTEEQLDKRICRDFEKFANKEFKNSLAELLPQKMIATIITKSEISEEKKVHQITKEERKRLVHLLKDFEIVISGFMPLEMAIITCGGIDVKEVNPKTMESKIVLGLYFAGEILDVDAYTGGFNLQIAFSTGYTAGKSIEYR